MRHQAVMSENVTMSTYITQKNSASIIKFT